MLKATDAKEAAKAVVAKPHLLAEARDRLSLVQRLVRPLSANDIYICIQPLVIMFGPPDFGQDEEAKVLQGAWFDLYSKALSDQPREAIDIAVQEWIRRGKAFFPKPSELNELAQETADELRLIAFRLRLAVERADRHKPAPKRTPEDAVAVKELVTEMRGPDGKIRLSKSVDDVVRPTSRSATADALRRLSGSL